LTRGLEGDPKQRKGNNQRSLAASPVMLLISIPFFAFRSLGEIIDGRVLFRLFLESCRQIEKA
jgi:ABC-type taurine transport system ATPase subunit